jgi:thiamine-monophosphate kinase
MPAAPDSIVSTPGIAQPGLDPECDRRHEIVIAIDTLVDGVHFATGTAPADVGFKALAVNLSDLAAMGADPRLALASVTHPDAGGDRGLGWLAAFEAGLGGLAQRFGVTPARPLTARGPLCVTVEVLGSVPRSMALRRAGARPGDRILVTGSLGDAGLALAADSAALPAPTRTWLQTRLARPEPRVEAGVALRNLASAAIDISDGLVADLGHVLNASGVGAHLTVDDLPLSPALRDQLPRERAWALALSSGDDYELCFTLAPDRLVEAGQRLGAVACGFTPIGTVTADAGLHIARADGSPFRPAPGYRHFS